MTRFTKYEFIVCEGLERNRFFVRSSSKENIWCTTLYFSPIHCFRNMIISYGYEQFLVSFGDILSVTTQTVVAESGTLEKLKLEIPEYLI
jgi:hypothetical protein